MYNCLTMVHKILRSTLLVLLVVVTGCGSSTLRYINPSANFSYIKKVAVLPFNNLSSDKYAGERIRSTLTVDLMSRGVYEVMEQGEVSKVVRMVLRSSGFEEGNVIEVNKENLKVLGEKLGVQAVLLGSVDEYATGSSAVVSVSVRMLDTSSGIILWQANATARGGGVLRSIIGLEPVDRTTLSRRAIKSALDSLL